MKTTMKIMVSLISFIGLTILLVCCSKTNDPNLPDATVKDADGNIYHTVTIGTQVWLVEDLKTTKLNDGTPIQNITDCAAYNTLTSPSYYWYDNNVGYKAIYGALYNWYAVNSGKLAPTGWRIPTESDWNTLRTYLGGENVAGGKLKEAGTSHWVSPNDATNESGFSAFGVGELYIHDEQPPNYSCYYLGLNSDGTWWSSTNNYWQYGAGAMVMVLWNHDTEMGIYQYDLDARHKNQGYAVRCIKN